MTSLWCVLMESMINLQIKMFHLVSGIKDRPICKRIKKNIHLLDLFLQKWFKSQWKSYRWIIWLASSSFLKIMVDCCCLKRRTVALFKDKSSKDLFLPWICRMKETKLAIIHQKLQYSETRNKGRAQDRLVIKRWRTTSNRTNRTIDKEQTFRTTIKGQKTTK